MTFDTLYDFIKTKMRMSHIYPLSLRVLAQPAPTPGDPPCTSGTSRVACAPSSVPQNQCPIIRSPWGSGG